MKIKKMKKYLVPTTEQIAKAVDKMLSPYITKTHIGVAAGKELDLEKKSIWLRRKDTDPSKIPTLVAHMDTVSPYHISPTAKEIIIKNNIISLDPNSPATCLGGDDRAGVAIIVETVKELARQGKPINFNILFTYGEERGCLGTKQFLKEKSNHFGASFMLEFDRKGGDLVGYNTGNNKFLEKLEEVYKRKTGRGSSSDIAHFQTELKINSANIGIGFCNEHGKNETLNFFQWHKTLNQTVELMLNKKALRTLGEYVWKDKPRTYSYGYNYSYYDDYHGYGSGYRTSATKTLTEIFKEFGETLTKHFDKKFEKMKDELKEELSGELKEELADELKSEIDDIIEDIITDQEEAKESDHAKKLIITADQDTCDHSWDDYGICLWCTKDVSKHMEEEWEEVEEESDEVEVEDEVTTEELLGWTKQDEEEERKWYQSLHEKEQNN